jgi:hypothetical protein
LRWVQRFDPSSGSVNDSGCAISKSADAGGNGHTAGCGALGSAIRKIVTTDHSAELPLFPDAEAIGTDRLDEPVFRLDHHLAVAIDQAGFAVDVDLREAEFVVVDDAILRLDDFASFFVDKAIETAEADCGAVVRELADPVVLRAYRDRAVAVDRAAQAARKRAHRQREGRRFDRPGRVSQRCAVGGDLALQDGFAGRRQFRRLILRERALRQRTAINTATSDQMRAAIAARPDHPTCYGLVRDDPWRERVRAKRGPGRAKWRVLE